MEIELTPEQDSFVHLGIEQGRYRDHSDALKEALAIWEKRQRARVELLASLEIAELELDAGLGTIYTEETIGNLAEDVAQRCRAKLKRN
jgi:Arc/MetJ-type ribon-helix-helix transcriptional regulator